MSRLQLKNPFSCSTPERNKEQTYNRVQLEAIVYKVWVLVSIVLTNSLPEKKDYARKKYSCYSPSEFLTKLVKGTWILDGTK